MEPEWSPEPSPSRAGITRSGDMRSPLSGIKISEAPRYSSSESDINGGLSLWIECSHEDGKIRSSSESGIISSLFGDAAPSELLLESGITRSWSVRPKEPGVVTRTSVITRIFCCVVGDFGVSWATDWSGRSGTAGRSFFLVLDEWANFFAWSTNWSICRGM